MNSISHGNYASYEKRAASIIEFEKAIKETLKSIEMPQEDLGLYMDMVDQKYAVIASFWAIKQWIGKS